MGSTWFGVHGGLSDKSILLTTFHELETIEVMSNCVFGKTLDKDPIDFGLVEIEGLWFGEVLQEVIDLFVVDLEEWTVDVECFCFGLWESFDLFEQWINCPRDESSIVLIRYQVFKEGVLMTCFNLFFNGILPIAAKHGVGFTWTSLSIGEDGHVVTFGEFW